MLIMPLFTSSATTKRSKRSKRSVSVSTHHAVVRVRVGSIAVGACIEWIILMLLLLLMMLMLLMMLLLLLLLLRSTCSKTKE